MWLLNNTYKQVALFSFLIAVFVTKTMKMLNAVDKK